MPWLALPKLTSVKTGGSRSARSEKLHFQGGAMCLCAIRAGFCEYRVYFCANAENFCAQR